MANRNSQFLLKRSNTPGKVPLPGDLLLGELALNTADVILYTSGTTANQILPIGWDRLSITGGTVTGNVTINGITTSSGLTLTNITNATGDFITITNSNVIRRRTPSEVLSDIGGQAALTNPVTGTGSAGQVSFWNGTTTQTGDNGLWWDNTNKRLGIGTTSPQRDLDVNGNIRVRSGAVDLSNDFNNQVYAFSNAMYLKVNGTERLTIDSSGTATFSSSVTARNATTAAALGQFSVMGAGEFMSTGTLAGYFWENRSGGVTSSSNWYGWYTTSGVIHLYNGSTNLISINGSTGDVGIGTASPSAKLEVVGQGTGSVKIGSTGFGGDWVGISLSGNLNTTDYNLLSSATNTSFFLNRPNGGDMLFRHNNVDQMIIKSSGNVGIGTTSPVVKLQVDGTITSTGVLTAYTSVPSINIGHNGDSAFIAATSGSGANTPISFSVGNNNEKMRITAAGNVGIGTTSPGEKLSLAGSTATTFGLSLEPSGWNSAKHRLTVPVSGDSSVWSFNYNGSAVDSSLYGASSMSIQQGTILFSTGVTNTAPSEKMRITSGGNVLIGTTTDDGVNRLQVNGSGTFTGRFNANDYTMAAWQVLDWTGSVVKIGGINTSQWSQLDFFTSGTTKMILTSGGNVGIGTTTPESKLHIANLTLDNSAYQHLEYVTANNTTEASGESYSGEASYGIGFRRQWSSSTFTNLAGIYAFGSGGWRGGLLFRTKNNTTSTGEPDVDALFLSPAGNVGIGTTDPNGKLEIRGLRSATKDLLLNLSKFDFGTTYFYQNYSNTFFTNGKSLEIELDAFPMMQLAVNNAANQGSVIFPNGSVLIGTTSNPASQKLVVFGDGQFTSNTNTVLNVNSNGGAALVNLTNAAGTQSIYGGVGGQNAMDFYTNSTFRMRLDASGNVLIGTTTDGGEKLQVSGTGRIDGTLGIRASATSSVATQIPVFTADPSGTTRTLVTRTPAELRSDIGAQAALTNPVTGTGTSGQVSFWNGTTTQSGDNGLWWDNTNTRLGIGTTSPYSRFTVLGTLSASTSQISIVNSEGGHAIIRSGIPGLSNNGISFITANVDGSGQQSAMVIDSSNRIGIGTTSPITRLNLGSYTGSRLSYINGTANTFDANGITITSSNTANAAIGGGIDLTNNVHSIGSFSPLISFSALSQSGTFNNNYAAIYGILAGDSGDGNWNTGHLAFATSTAFGATEKMRITSAGDVGIGTTSPTQKLDVSGNVNVRSSLPTIFFDRNGSYTWRISNGDGSTFPTSTLNIANNASTAIATFLDNGNVGIGTTTPILKLDVSGAIRAVNTNTNGGSFITLGETFDGSTPFYIERHGSTNALALGVDIWNSSNGFMRFATNNTERMRITAGGNVGIGTTSPTAPLDTNGVRIGRNFSLSDRATVRLDSANTSSPSDILFGHTAAANQTGWDGVYWSLSSRAGNDNNKFYIYRGAGNPGGSGEEVILALQPNGNVGIGTTSPNALLNIVSTSGDAFIFKGSNGKEFVSINHLGFIRTRASDTNGANMHFFDNGGTKRMEMSVGTTSMNWYSDALLSTFMVFQHTTGNVGIGTTSPNNLLNTFIADGSGGFSKGIRIQTGNGTFTSGHGGMLEFQNEDVLTAGIRGVRESGWGSGMAFYVHNTSSGNTFGSTFVERMRINESGFVGIGTSGPTEILHLNSSSAGAFIRFQNTGGSGVYLGSRNEVMEMYTSGVERVRISSGGSLLVGHTTIPTESAWLGTAVFGRDGFNKVIIGSLNSTSVGAYVGGHNSSLDAWEVLNVAGTAVIFRTEQNERMRLASDGNFGIGTTSPAAKFHLQGSNLMATFQNSSTGANQYTQLELIAGSRDAYIWLGNQNTTSWAGDGGLNIYTGTGNMDFWTAATQKMRITSAGNVGIGTTSPANKLQVSGSGRVFNAVSSNDQVVGSLTCTTGGISTLGFNAVGSASDYHVRVGASTTNFVAFTNDTERLRITSAGDVGIGTTSPSQKLDVQGNITITKTILSNQENLDVDSGATRVIATIASATYDAAFFDFVIKKGTNLRAGTVYATHNGTSVEFTETSTNDLGNTSDVTLSVDLSGGNIRLLATTLSNDWIIKSLVRGI
jgi:hypothetical protein